MLAAHASPPPRTDKLHLSPKLEQPVTYSFHPAAANYIWPASWWFAFVERRRLNSAKPYGLARPLALALAAKPNGQSSPTHIRTATRALMHSSSSLRRTIQRGRGRAQVLVDAPIKGRGRALGKCSIIVGGTLNLACPRAVNAQSITTSRQHAKLRLGPASIPFPECPASVHASPALPHLRMLILWPVRRNHAAWLVGLASFDVTSRRIASSPA